MPYIKNIAFTKLIKADGKLREFNFRKTQSEGNPIYNINVSDERGNRLYFVVVKLEDRWIIGQLDVPGWIREASPHFHDAIEQYESGKVDPYI
jgi:hypothetical protein